MRRRLPLLIRKGTRNDRAPHKWQNRPLRKTGPHLWIMDNTPKPNMSPHHQHKPAPHNTTTMLPASTPCKPSRSSSNTSTKPAGVQRWTHGAKPLTAGTSQPSQDSRPPQFVSTFPHPLQQPKAICAKVANMSEAQPFSPTLSELYLK